MLDEMRRNAIVGNACMNVGTHDFFECEEALNLAIHSLTVMLI